MTTCTQALIIAHENEAIYGNLLLAVNAVIFLGVPHRGSDVAFWGTFLARLGKALQLGFGTNTNFITALQRNSATFSEIARQFTPRTADLKIRTFYETEKLAGQLVSATL